MHLNEKKIKELEKKATDIRVSIIEMLVEAGSGHTAGSLGMADIFTALYFHILKYNPKNQIGKIGIDLFYLTDTFAQFYMRQWLMLDIFRNQILKS